jgi:membrane-bound transcription factor site-1 protease
VLDWHGDHPFTNFHDTLNVLREAGYFVEILHSPATCFHPDNYGAYMVMDSEEEWYP